MIKPIAENLFTVPGILTREECEEFIARGEGIGFEAATVSIAGGARSEGTHRPAVTRNGESRSVGAVTDFVVR